MIHIIYEHWKTIEQNGWKIKVSSLGRVKYKRKILTPQINNAGYYQVCINNKYYRVHLLVAIAFLGKKNQDGLTIDHIDGNRRNNTLKNLELVSLEENQKRAQQMRGLNNIKRVYGFDHAFTSVAKALNFYLHATKLHKSGHDTRNFEQKVLSAIQTGNAYLGTTWKAETRW